MTTVGGALVYPRMKEMILQLTRPADAESTHVCMATIFKVHIYVGTEGGAPMYAPPHNINSRERGRSTESPVVIDPSQQFKKWVQPNGAIGSWVQPIKFGSSLSDWVHPIS